MAGDDLNIPQTTEDLAKFADVLDELKNKNLAPILQVFDSLKEKIKATKEELSKVKEGTEEYKRKSEQLNTYTQALEKCKNALGGFIAVSDAAKDSIGNFKTNIEGVEGSLAKMGQSSNPAVAMMKGFFNQLQEGGKTAAGAGALIFGLENSFTRGIIDPLGSASEQVKSFGTFASTLNTILKNLADVTSTGYRGMVAFGESFEDAKRKAQILPDEVARISASIGVSKDQTYAWIKSMSEASPSMKMVGESVIDSGKSIAFFEQQMLLAKRAGLEMSNVQKLATDQFRNFNQSGEDVNKSLGLFINISKETGRQVKDVMDQISAASTPFGIFGRQLDETAGMWKTFADGMKGLPIEEVGKMVQTVSSNIAGMKLETQAFVAQMSGMGRGATALGGALKMEMDMRMPGGAERNLERTMQTISRLTGGRIINLQEATQSPALEMQFQMQRQLAGQMLGVTDQKQQSRLLEVLQNVQQGGVADVDALKELQGTTDEGRKIQEKSNSLLEQIAASTGRMAEGMVREIDKMSDSARSGVMAAGRAAGAPAAGNISDPREMREFGRHMANSADTLVNQMKESLPKIFTDIQGTGLAIEVGAKSLQSQKKWVAEHTAIKEEQKPFVMTPFQAPDIDELLMTPKPMEVGPKSIRERPENKIGYLPEFDRRRELVIPENIRRQEETPPIEEERYEATIPEQKIQVNVVCEKCHDKRTYEIVRDGIRGASGEDHSH